MKFVGRFRVLEHLPSSCHGNSLSFSVAPPAEERQHWGGKELWAEMHLIEPRKITKMAEEGRYFLKTNSWFIEEVFFTEKRGRLYLVMVKDHRSTLNRTMESVALPPALCLKLAG